MFCRAKRIVKRTNFDGSIRYIGQTKNFWGVWEDGDGGESRNSIHHTYEDALEWYCENCNHQLFRAPFVLDNIETDMPSIFNRYYSSKEKYRDQVIEIGKLNYMNC